MLVAGLELDPGRVLPGTHTLVRAPSDLALREQPGSALCLVDPRGIGRGEMQLEPGIAQQPAMDRRSLVGSVAVEHQMDIEVGWDFGVDALQKAEALGAAMATVEISDHPAADDVQGGEQGGGPMSMVVMGLALGDPGAGGQLRWVRSSA